MKKNVFQVIEKSFSPDIKLTVKEAKRLIYIEGSSESLKWLAKIIKAYAGQNFEDDFWITPKGPGSAYFTKKSTHGIYLYNTDIAEKAQKSK